MSIPGEALERRRLKRRPFAWAFAVLAIGLALYLYAPLPAPDAPPAGAGDCVLLHMYSNGYHSDIAVPAAVFPVDHALRRLFPQAQSFLIGWGDEKFYYSDGTDLWLGLNAIIPPSPSVLHVAWNAQGAARYLGPNDDTDIAVSREGAARLVAYIDRALVTSGGDAVVTAPGKVVGRSFFLRSRGDFHLFNVCNQWMARALRAAGVDVNARAAWLAGPLIRQVHHRAQTACPA